MYRILCHDLALSHRFAIERVVPCGPPVLDSTAIATCQSQVYLALANGVNLKPSETAPEILRFAQDDRQDTSQVRSQEVLSPNLYWRGSNVRSIEFTVDKGSCSLMKIHCSGLAKWVGSAEIVKLVLL